jgi:hypothetical protein
MSLRNRRTVLVGLVVVAAALFLAGIGAAFLSRHDTICKDRRPPLAQRTQVIGATEYLCHDGRTVTK